MTLAIEGLRKGYGGFELGPIDLSVEREVLAVLGPSGGGKSTLLQTVAGVVDPDAGQVSLDGRPLRGRPPEDRGTVLLFQDGALFPHLTARENIAYPGASPDRVARLATALEIGDVLDQPAPELSGGQRQRVALARALAAEPAALLLDEPLANLDAPVKRRLRDEMRDRLTDAEVPVIYVTHDQREAAAVGDRVAVLADGTIHQVGTPREVFDHPTTPFVARFTGGENVVQGTLQRAADGGEPHVHWSGHRLPVDPTALDTDWDDGTTIWVCVRPERLRLRDPPADPTGTHLRGTVERAVYEGDRETVSVRLAPSEEELIVAVSAGSAADIRPEAPVAVAVDPSAVHVIGPDEDRSSAPLA